MAEHSKPSGGFLLNTTQRQFCKRKMNLLLNQCLYSQKAALKKQLIKKKKTPLFNEDLVEFSLDVPTHNVKDDTMESTTQETNESSLILIEETNCEARLNTPKSVASTANQSMVLRNDQIHQLLGSPIKQASIVDY